MHLEGAAGDRGGLVGEQNATRQRRRRRLRNQAQHRSSRSAGWPPARSRSGRRQVVPSVRALTQIPYLTVWLAGAQAEAGEPAAGGRVAHRAPCAYTPDSRTPAGRSPAPNYRGVVAAKVARHRWNNPCSRVSITARQSASPPSARAAGPWSSRHRSPAPVCSSQLLLGPGRPGRRLGGVGRVGPNPEHPGRRLRRRGLLDHQGGQGHHRRGGSRSPFRPRPALPALTAPMPRIASSTTPTRPRPWLTTPPFRRHPDHGPAPCRRDTRWTSRLIESGDGYGMSAAQPSGGAASGAAVRALQAAARGRTTYRPARLGADSGRGAARAAAIVPQVTVAAVAARIGPRGGLANGTGYRLPTAARPTCWPTRTWTPSTTRCRTRCARHGRRGRRGREDVLCRNVEPTPPGGPDRGAAAGCRPGGHGGHALPLDPLVHRLQELVGGLGASGTSPVLDQLRHPGPGRHQVRLRPRRRRPDRRRLLRDRLPAAAR